MVALPISLRLHTSPQARPKHKPDALSRQADHGSGQGDNDNLTLLDPELFWIHALAGVRLEGDERNILREVHHSLRDNVQEESVAKVARELRKDKGRGTVKSTEWSESDRLLMFRGKIYIPNDRDLRRRIVGTTMDGSGWIRINIHGWWINSCGYGYIHGLSIIHIIHKTDK
jgi:hypothetical protein